MPKQAALLVNFGSPETPEVRDARRFLKQLLSDPRVLDMPAALRWMLLRGVILPFRARRTAARCRAVWTAEGSPMLFHSRRLLERLRERIRVPAALAMRYGRPAAGGVLEDLAEAGVESLLVMPLFPHYARSSYETAAEKVRDETARRKLSLRLDFMPPCYAEDGYIGALAAAAEPYFRNEYDKLLFSFHSLPADGSGAALNYRGQCLKTAEKLSARLNLPPEKREAAFQSKFGPGRWLGPFTEKRLAEMPGEGVRKLLVICPSFTADNLETLDEIGRRGKAVFIQSGGESLDLIPCLNSHPAWASFLAKQINLWLNQLA